MTRLQTKHKKRHAFSIANFCDTHEVSLTFLAQVLDFSYAHVWSLKKEGCVDTVTLLALKYIEVELVKRKGEGL